MTENTRCSVCDTRYQTTRQARICESLPIRGELFRIGEQVVGKRDYVITTRHTITGRFYKLRGNFGSRFHMCFYEIDPSVLYYNTISKIISGPALADNYNKLPIQKRS